MQEIIGFALFGLGGAAVYTLLAQGAVLIYRGSGVVNFAQGGFALVGAYVYFEALKVVPKWPAALLGIAAAGLLGLLVQVAIMWPMRRSSALARVVATLGILAVLTQAVSIRYQSTTHYVPSLVPQGGVSLAGVSLSQDRLWLFGIALVLTTALWLGYRYTRIGLATSGVAENQTVAASLGWSPRMIAGLNWTLGAALAGAAGVLLAPISGGLTPGVFVMPMVASLSTALIGSFRSFPLTMLGGVIIAVLQSECTHYISTPGWTNAVPFVVIILLIVLRGRALPLRSFRSDRLPAVGSGKINPVGVGVGLGLSLIGIYAFSEAFASSIALSAGFALVALSLVVVTGYAGQISLAQYALAGIGALASARMMALWHVPFLAALVLGMAITVVVGLVISLPALRARGVNLAVVTLGLALVIETVVLGNPDHTGGVVTGTVVADPNLFGWHIQSVQYPRRYALVCVIVLALAAVLVARLRRRGAGRRLLAVRDNERAAASVGVNVVGAKLYAFGVGAALAALGGSLIALKDSFVDFTQFTTLQSVNVLMLTVIGAIGFVLGGLISGVAVAGGAFQQFLSNYFDLSNWWLLILGLLLLVQLVVLPEGIAADLGRQWRLITGVLRRSHHRKAKVAALSAPQELGRVAAKSLELKDLTVQFGSTVALNGVSLTVNPGEIVGLIGPNGAGKTTLIDVATGVIKARAGQVLLGGEPVDRLSVRQRVRRGLARSWQSDELFEVMTVAENLRVAAEPGGFGCYVRDLVWRERRLPPAVAASVQQFELQELLQKLPTQLSFATRRLVGVARAMATEPSILLLDEPAAGLDENSTEELISHIRRLARERGLGILLIEHDVSMVMRACDRVAAINFGEEVLTGTPAQVRAHPVVISAYLGRAEGHHAGRARVGAATGAGADSPPAPPASPGAHHKPAPEIGGSR